MTNHKSFTAENLLPGIYESLVRLARNRIAHYKTHEYLNPSELVHEAYLRVVKGQPASFESRRHLFFAISRAMGDLLAESARRNATAKRGGGLLNIELDSVMISVEPRRGDFVDLERALRKLEHHSPTCARVVVLSYFVGLTYPEIAKVLRLSLATVERRWKYSRAWLWRELGQGRVRGFEGGNRLNE